MFNPYEYAELELQDLYCEQCGEIISTQEYINNDGLCDNCYNEIDFQIGKC